MIQKDVEHDQWYKTHRIWVQQKRFDKKLKEHVDGVVDEYTKGSVARKKEIREVFTQKCIIQKSQPGPSEFEKTIQLLGTSDMLPARLRGMCKKILQKDIGIIKPLTVQDRNQKAFDNYKVT